MGESVSRAGPLSGVRVVEMAGIGPGPMCAMLLADMGATVIRIDRAQPVEMGVQRPLRYNFLLRSREAIAVDLKQPEAAALVLDLVAGADALIEGFRPGVMERLGLGPDACLARNPKLVYGRMTGWGQDGPLAQAAGHDIDYIALTGALHAIGRAGGAPTQPLNLVGDFGGGALYLAMGLLAGIISARTTGKGQVVDAAMVDGAASLMTGHFGLHAAGLYRLERGANMLDGGAYFYDVYECADGEWIAVGALEARFYAELVRLAGLDPEVLGPQQDRARWPEARAHVAARFRSKTRAQWCAILDGSDACFAPVLSMAEAPWHPHLAHRGTFVEVDGAIQPGPAPRFTGTPCGLPSTPKPPSVAGAQAALGEWLGADAAKALVARGVVRGQTDTKGN